MNQFARALYDICLEEESTASVEAICNNALSRLEAASWTIREYNRGTVTAIHFDFSRLAPLHQSHAGTLWQTLHREGVKACADPP
jgi:hypothetical protein